MTTECRWIEGRFEDLLSDDPQIRREVEIHTSACRACRREIEAYGEVDRLLGSYFASRLHRAALPQPSRSLRRLVLTTSAITATVVLLVWAGLIAGRTDPTSGLTAESLPTPGISVSGKAIERVDSALAKPTENPERAGEETADALDGNAVPPVSDGAFYVMNAAGYAYTLDDFRGSVVVMGVFDENAAGAREFESVYDTVTSRPDLQFLAIGIHDGVPEPVERIPSMTNRGSSLLGIGIGEYAVLTREGRVHRQGVLTEANSAADLRSALVELGIGDPQ